MQPEFYDYWSDGQVWVGQMSGNYLRTERARCEGSLRGMVPKSRGGIGGPGRTQLVVRKTNGRTQESEKVAFRPFWLSAPLGRVWALLGHVSDATGTGGRQARCGVAEEG